MTIFETLFEVVEKLQTAGVDFVIGGSMASSVWGQERNTRDVDIAASLSVEQIDLLEEAFEWPYVIDAELMRESLKGRQEFAAGQILHGETLDKFDIFLLPHDEYSRGQLERKRWVEFLPGKSLPFASPEDIVITKLRWFVLGNKVSDRQWNDIVQVLETQGEDLDEAYMTRWAEHFGVLELLREAQSQVVA
ncbi:MAG: hypothetical protein GC165_15815 [Armatimonadetes bacterium]|nr:hypothetical protein [Armatimonadota bacterium]MBS1725456.1 hypothetical protein [Armatimonadota bacterium]